MSTNGPIARGWIGDGAASCGECAQVYIVIREDLWESCATARASLRCSRLYIYNNGGHILRTQAKHILIHRNIAPQL